MVNSLFGPRRALADGLLMSFATVLCEESRQIIEKSILAILKLKVEDLYRASSAPSAMMNRAGNKDDFVLVQNFWIRKGPLDAMTDEDLQDFVITKSAKKRLRDLARSVSSRDRVVCLFVLL